MNVWHIFFCCSHCNETKKVFKEVFSPISTKTLELDQIIEVCISYLIIYSIICLFTKKGNSKSSLIRTSKKKCKSSSCTSLTKINHKSKNSFEIDQFLTYACKKMNLYDVPTFKCYKLHLVWYDYLHSTFYVNLFVLKL